MTEAVRPEGRHAASAVPRAALYCRVSTTGQTAENQVLALRSFASARGWVVIEFVDHGVSGAKEKRPQLDALMAAARARKVDVVACVKLDRLARSVHHLVALVRELEALGVDLVVLDQAIDTTTPSGRLLFHVLASVAEFERDLIRDRVLAGLRRAQEHGTKSGRPIGRPARALDIEDVRRRRAVGQAWRTIGRALKIPIRTIRRRAKAGQNPQVNCAQGGPVSTHPSLASEGRGTT